VISVHVLFVFSGCIAVAHLGLWLLCCVVTLDGPTERALRVEQLVTSAVTLLSNTRFVFDIVMFKEQEALALILG